MGRPSKYSEELALAICTRLAEGESLKKICGDEGMPNRSTVNDWRHEHPAFSAMFARAREDCSDTMAEAAVAIAMTATPETAQAVRVKFDALRWYASKLGPKTYGDRTQLVGKITHQLDVVRLSDAELTALAAAGMAIANGEDDGEDDPSRRYN